MLLPESIQPSELTALPVAIISLALWLHNRLETGTDLRIARKIVDRANITKAEIEVIAQIKFKIRSTNLLVGIQTGITFIIGLLLTFTPNPASSLLSRWTIAGVMILISLGVAVYAYDWKRNGERTLAYAKRKVENEQAE